jgi:hypothetical protein
MTSIVIAIVSMLHQTPQAGKILQDQQLRLMEIRAQHREVAQVQPKSSDKLCKVVGSRVVGKYVETLYSDGSSLFAVKEN